jgi:hypothetical protein
VLVHLVADYGVGDLAFAEVSQRIVRALPEAWVHSVAVAPFDTLAGGFCVAQLALTDGPSGPLVIHNVAPRRDEPGPRPANEGERFCAGRTESGVLVVGPNSGFSFSFCAAELLGLRYLAVPASGSQFRSRELLPGRSRRCSPATWTRSATTSHGSGCPNLQNRRSPTWTAMAI